VTSRPRHQRGFTLIELILALVICAMLATTMYTAMAVTQRARRSATDAVNRTRAISIAAEMLRRDLESVPPPTGQLAGPFVGIRQAGASGTGGDADQMEFFTIGADEPVRPDYPLAEGIRKIQIMVRSDTGTAPVLVRRVTRNLLPSVEPTVEEEVICRDVRSFAVKYYDGTTWQEYWDSTTLGDVLPMAVAITLEVNDPSAVRPEDSLRRVTRVFTLSCGKPADPLAGLVPQ
jgi:type II secretion system protein J